MTLVNTQLLTPQICQITLNDPNRLNAMGEQMARDFQAEIQTLNAQKTKLRAIILTGAGRAFSAGGDLEMLEAKTKKSPEWNRREMLSFYYSFLSILSLDVPVIVALNGHAIGAGLCLSCACDIRIASDDTKLGFAFTVLGLHPGMGATYFLPKVVGEARARELLLTGRIFTAPEALSMGLISETVPQAQVLDRAQAIAEQICENGPAATSQLLQSLRGERGSLEGCLEREALSQSLNYASDEFHEGIRAKQEKRKPLFS
jgi:enoyl-CoA hydratase/carnithine racemase